jgi:chromosome segregation ATPase
MHLRQWRYVLCLRLAATAFPVAVAGCATGNCTGDARTDGVTCAAQAISSGSYGRQTAAMEGTLAEDRRQAAAERQIGVQMRASLGDLRARRGRLEKELAALLARIDDLAKQGTEQRGRIADLRLAVERAQQRVTSKPLDATALEEEERGLQLYYRQLREVTQT